MELIGWASNICFSLCTVPMVVSAMRRKHARDVSGGFLALWAAGEIFGLIYAGQRDVLPILVNYGFNFVCLSILTYYKISTGGK